MNVKKLLAIALTLTLVLTACNSADTTFAATYGDTKVPAGVYLYNMMNNISIAASKASDMGKDPLKQEIEGVKGDKWVEDQTTMNIKAYVTAEKEFARLNLEIDEYTLNMVTNAVNDIWESSSSRYTKNGISKESLLACYMNTQKKIKLLDSYYGENGEKSVSDDKIKEYYEETYLRINQIIISKTTTKEEETIAVVGEELMKLKEQANSLFKKLDETNDFELVLKEYETLQNLETQPVHDHGDNKFPHDIIVTKDQPYFPTSYLSQVATTDINKAGIYEDDSMYIIFFKKDINANPEDYTKRKQEMSKYVASETFEQDLSTMVGDDVVLNQKAIDRYKPNKIKF